MIDVRYGIVRFAAVCHYNSSVCVCVCVCVCLVFLHEKVSFSKAGDTLSTCHVSSRDVNAYSWNVRGDLTLKSMAQIHTSVTILTSRDLAWNSGRLTCQHASQISAVPHIS